MEALKLFDSTKSESNQVNAEIWKSCRSHSQIRGERAQVLLFTKSGVFLDVLWDVARTRTARYSNLKYHNLPCPRSACVPSIKTPDQDSSKVVAVWAICSGHQCILYAFYAFNQASAHRYSHSACCCCATNQVGNFC